MATKIIKTTHLYRIGKYSRELEYKITMRKVGTKYEVGRARKVNKWTAIDINRFDNRETAEQYFKKIEKKKLGKWKDKRKQEEENNKMNTIRKELFEKYKITLTNNEILAVQQLFNNSLTSK